MTIRTPLARDTAPRRSSDPGVGRSSGPGALIDTRMAEAGMRLTGAPCDEDGRMRGPAHTARTPHGAGTGRADLSRPATATSTVDPDDDEPDGDVGRIQTA